MLIQIIVFQLVAVIWILVVIKAIKWLYEFFLFVIVSMKLVLTD